MYGETKKKYSLWAKPPFFEKPRMSGTHFTTTTTIVPSAKIKCTPQHINGTHKI